MDKRNWYVIYDTLKLQKDLAFWSGVAESLQAFVDNSRNYKLARDDARLRLERANRRVAMIQEVLTSRAGDSIA